MINQNQTGNIKYSLKLEEINKTIKIFLKNLEIIRKFNIYWKRQIANNILIIRCIIIGLNKVKWELWRTFWLVLLLLLFLVAKEIQTVSSLLGSWSSPVGTPCCYAILCFLNLLFVSCYQQKIRIKDDVFGLFLTHKQDNLDSSHTVL